MTKSNAFVRYSHLVGIAYIIGFNCESSLQKRVPPKLNNHVCCHLRRKSGTKYTFAIMWSAGATNVFARLIKRTMVSKAEGKLYLVSKPVTLLYVISWRWSLYDYYYYVSVTSTHWKQKKVSYIHITLKGLSHLNTRKLFKAVYYMI